MSLFPNEDILALERICGKLTNGRRQNIVYENVNDCYKYAKTINTNGEPFPSESMIMGLLFSQHKIIEWLEGRVSKLK